MRGGRPVRSSAASTKARPGWRSRASLTTSVCGRGATAWSPAPPITPATNQGGSARFSKFSVGRVPRMKIEGIHHVTCITGDAPANVDFYARVLGLRMVKKTVNQDDPTVYHLFYADEKGSAGADITFFEYPRAPRGRAGDGMVHTTVFRVASEESLDFWAERLGVEEVATHRDGRSLRFEDPEGLALELMVSAAGDEPLTAEHPDIPEQHRLQGFEGVRAYSSAPEHSKRLLEDGLGFEAGDESTWTVVGNQRRGWITYDA